MRSMNRSLLHCITILCLLVGCSSAPSPPCPTDELLIQQFNSHGTRFAQLLSDPNNSELLQSLAIKQVFTRSAEPKQILFQVWFQDFFGPGGCGKGYAYLEEAPWSLVKSIDNSSDPGSPEEKEIYRHLRDNWYLYYHSTN